MSPESEGWILPATQTMAELDSQDYTTTEENLQRLHGELDLFTRGGDLWMRLWAQFRGVTVYDRTPQMTLMHLAKALRDLRCARNLTVGGYEAEAHLILRRADESLNLCALFLTQPSEAEAYAGCKEPSEFRAGFGAGVVRKKLGKAGRAEMDQVRKSFHGLMSSSGHESWKSIATFLTTPEDDGRLRLLVGGQPHSETARITLGIACTQMALGLQTMAAVLAQAVSTDLKAEIEEFGHTLSERRDTLYSEFLAAQKAENLR